MKYATLDIEMGKKERARQKEFEQQLAETVDSFDRQSKAFINTLEDKALKNKLEKERSARKAEMNRSLVARVGDRKPVTTPSAQSGGHPSLDKEGSTALNSTPGLRRGADASSAGWSDADGVIRVGSKVITSFGNVGTVEKMDKETAEVLVGGLRLREKLVNLQLAEEQAETQPVGSVPSRSRASGTKNVISPLSIDGRDADMELNLIGRTTSEAEYELDRFIDEAYLASLPRIRIIHGFGTGALKNFVHHTLKNHELIANFNFAPPDQGGNGATIAELKDRKSVV